MMVPQGWAEFDLRKALGAHIGLGDMF